MNDMEEIKYTDCYVAYLDILGFKKITKDSNWDCNKIYGLLRKSKKKPIKYIYHGEEQIMTSDGLNTYVMSDSIVLYIDSSIKDALSVLIANCSMLLNNLVCNDPPVHVRGSIVRGDVFCSDGIIFGPALTEAYTLEEECAIYPRVILTKKLHSETNKEFDPMDNNVSIDCVYEDDDEWFCVKNFITMNSKKDDLNKYIKYIDNILLEEKNQKIREKLIYIKKHINPYPHIKKK